MRPKADCVVPVKMRPRTAHDLKLTRVVPVKMRPKTCEVHDCPMSENPPHKIALLHIAATVSTTTNTTGILVQNGWVAYLHSCQAFRQRGDAAQGNRRRFAARDGVRFACKNKVVNSFCMPLRALNVSKTRRKNCYWILLGITCWHLVMLEFTCRFWRVQFFSFYCTCIALGSIGQPPPKYVEYVSANAPV